jgi:hypothetical protein
MMGLALLFKIRKCAYGLLNSEVNRNLRVFCTSKVQKSKMLFKNGRRNMFAM